MSGTLRPTLPLEENETVISWVCRLSAFHTGDDVFRFLNDLSLPFQSLIAGDGRALRILAEVTGETPHSLRERLPERTAPRYHSFRGNHFSSEFMPQTDTAYCPRCLVEDDLNGCDARVGRWMWLFEPVHVCERHNVPLIVHHKKCWRDLLRDLKQIAPAGEELSQLAENATEKTISPLQRYVIDRLNGGANVDWLDKQSIEQASRATMMIGVLAGWGASVNLHSLSKEDWYRAGRLGFEITREGERGIREFLETVQRDHRAPTAHAGPQAVFGPLYKWLQFNRADKDYGPIKTVLREHILDTMALKVGMNLLGQVVQKPRRVTVKGLADKAGLHVKTLRRALVAKGLLDDTDASSLNSSVDVVAGENFAAALSRAITHSEVPGYMNSTRGQADMLLREGFLEPIVQQSGDSGCFASWIDTRDIDDLMRRISAHARVVDRPTAGTLRIPDAAQKARRLTTEIVSLLLDGRLSTVERITAERGYMSLYVDPNEIKAALPSPQGDTRPGRTEAANILGITTKALKRLLDIPGQSFFCSDVRLGHAGIMECFSFEEIQRFKERYVTLGELKERSGWHHSHVLKALRSSGIEPICDPKSICVYLFERERADPAIL